MDTLRQDQLLPIYHNEVRLRVEALHPAHHLAVGLTVHTSPPNLASAFGVFAKAATTPALYPSHYRKHVER
ncbi:MAG: hypothetical protein SFU83_24440 [Meiothermus sp.]|nr:hypothetical protein [Meiothermus sp.]